MKNQTTIKELWNLCGIEGCGVSAEVRHLEKLLARHRDNLVSTLTEKQREIFEKYTDCLREVEGINACDAFTYGFSLGIRLSGEAWSESLT
ncbi:MAG: hypothetical protein IJW29_02545 [Clostridia bacterium]|nr:hypothetical protein [Clostridia bacterium]